MFLKYNRLGIIWALFILILCSIPGRDIPSISFLDLISFDKLVHAGMFLVLMVLLAKGFSLQYTISIIKNRYLFFSFIISVFYGGLLEIFQNLFFTERTADVFDFIANSLGVLLGLFFYDYLNRRWLVRMYRQ